MSLHGTLLFWNVCHISECVGTARVVQMWTNSLMDFYFTTHTRRQAVTHTHTNIAIVCPFSIALLPFSLIKAAVRRVAADEQISAVHYESEITLKDEVFLRN